jgi:hypothetical protein
MELRKTLAIEIFVLSLISGISIIIGNVLSNPFTILGIWNFFFIIFYSIYNIFRIIKLKNKKNYLKKLYLTIIQFIIINSILSLIMSLYFWYTRDLKLIEITKLEYTFGYIFLDMIFKLCSISFIIVQVINLKSFLKINKIIYSRLLPLKICLLNIFLAFAIATLHIETICIWDLLQDTRHSDNFNVYNIDKIEVEMEKEKVIELIGNPYFSAKNEDSKDWQSWTSDGKSKIGDFAWLDVEIIFENDLVDNVNINWRYD